MIILDRADPGSLGFRQLTPGDEPPGGADARRQSEKSTDGPQRSTQPTAPSRPSHQLVIGAKVNRSDGYEVYLVPDQPGTADAWNVRLAIVGVGCGLVLLLAAIA